MLTALIIDTADFPQLEGQEVGRELDLDITAVVVKINDIMHAKGGSPSSLLTLAVTRIDITQTT
jgi:hypothetical protein